MNELTEALDSQLVAADEQYAHDMLAALPAPVRRYIERLKQERGALQAERDRLLEENALLKEVLTGIRAIVVALHSATAPFDGGDNA